MERNSVWKPLSILFVLAMCLWYIFPVKERLKPGLDLAGGTTLVYQVNVPPGSDAKQVIEDTISVLQARVDPTGVRNLVWRPQAGNRIEIQMAEANENTRLRREEFVAARKQLLEGNLSRQQLESALRADPQQRQQILTAMAADNQSRRQALERLAQAYDQRQSAEEPYRAAEAAHNQAQEQLKALASDAPAEQRNKLQEQAGQLQTQLSAVTRKVIDARKEYQQALTAVLGTNIDGQELQRIFDLPLQATVGGASTTPRQTQLEKLKSDHPQRAQQVEAVAQAYTAYEKYKSDLDDPNDLIELLKGSGVLEFRIAPSSVPDVAEFKEQLRTLGPRAGSDKDFRWFPIDKLESWAEKARLLEQAKSDPESYFAGRGLIAQTYGNDVYLLLANTPESSITQQREGWKLSKATRSIDDMGFPAVAFQLNEVGGQYMGALTGSHKQQPMSILLDNKVMSAPTIQSQIHSSGIITGGSGGFGPEEMQYLLRTLNAGSLQGALSQAPISISKTGAQFGEDNLRSGLRAAVWSLIVVGAFMAVYYLFWGMVANFALLANMVIILGVMAMMQATFTLAGIAGCVLTIGMAVDANVLIFERIREETERGNDLPTAIRQGFDRALSAILDSNATTLITCLILGYTASADIKGFAVTLGIGMVANIFTAVFASHVLINLVMKWFRPKRLPMLPTVAPALNRFLNPNIDWLKHSKKFIAVSIILVALGLAAIIGRGRDFLDIEFRSGTQVTFSLAPDKWLPIQEVRQRLSKIAKEKNLPEIAGDRATVVTVGDTRGATAHEFSVATLMDDPNVVSDAIKAAFADVLDTQLVVDFADMQAESLRVAPVFPVRQASLGQTINRAGVTDDVGEYVGGVAVVLDDLSPATTVADLTSRLERMSLQPKYQQLGYRNFAVIGMDLAPGVSQDVKNPLYRSVVVVARDHTTNYLEQPETFYDKDGLADSQWALVHDALQRDTSLGSVASFSSQVSATMQEQAFVAIFLSWLSILVYIWFRFGSLSFGLGAIVSLIHDVLVAVGLFAASAYVADTAIGRALLLDPFRLNLAAVAAALTLIGYSVNDTIVLFDRVRENKGKLTFPTPQMINDSINQTFSRTILTAGTVLISVLILYAVGGEGIHGFAFIMLVGTIVGCYSTIAIASPIVLLHRRIAEAKEHRREQRGPIKSPSPRQA